jgi:hypothetical protein
MYGSTRTEGTEICYNPASPASPASPTITEGIEHASIDNSASAIAVMSSHE